MTHLHSFRMTIATIAIVIGCSASAAVADEDKTEGNADPLESLNRFTSGFNSFLRKGFVDPMVDLYQYVTPDPLENAISNAASNLSEPITIGSSLL